MCVIIGKSFSQIELKSEGKKESFEKKLSDIKKTGVISRATFQSLAKDVSGGAKYLADFLVKNDIVPEDNIKTLTSKPFFEIAKNAKVLVKTANLKELLKNDKAIDVFKKEGKLSIPENTPKIFTAPGVSGKIENKITLGHTTLDVGTPFILQKKDNDYFLQTERFEIINEEPIIYRDLIKIENINSKEIKESLKLDPEVIYKKVNKPLFEKPISLTDIKQGGLGDCFLISGIYSIAKSDPNFIESMMKDNQDGTITVKLFEKNQKTKELEPKYITIEKSIPKDDKKANDTLWVQILEKAYATHMNSYSRIKSGGYTSDVFETFLGKKAHFNQIDVKNKTLANVINTTGANFIDLIKDNKAFELIKNKPTIIKDDLSEIIKELKEKYTDDNIEVNYGKELVKPSILIERFEKFILSGLKKEGTNYSTLQDDLFNKITKSLSHRENLAAATDSDIGYSTEKGGSGESKVDGFAGNHAYAILDTFEMNGNKFIRVANPWGTDFSRDYSMEDNKLVKKQFNKKDYSYLPESDNKKGGGIPVNESWIELNDFANMFNKFYYTEK